MTQHGFRNGRQLGFCGPLCGYQSCSRKMKRGRIAANIAKLPELLGRKD
jgi:hypothetical protein